MFKYLYFKSRSHKLSQIYFRLYLMKADQYEIGHRGCACDGLCEVEVGMTFHKPSGKDKLRGGWRG